MGKIFAIVFSLSFLMGSTVARAQSSWTGINKIEALTAEGSPTYFRYHVKGKLVICWFHIVKLVAEGSEDKNGVFTAAVREITFTNNQMECASRPDAEDKTVTTFSGVDYKSGKIVMTIAAVPYSAPNQRYRLTLSDLHQGTMVALPLKNATPPTKK